MDSLHFLDLILHIDKTLDVLVAEYGTWVYVVLALIVFSETGLIVLFFLPGDTMLFIAGALCATGTMNILLLMALLIFAAVAGGTTNYWIGQAVGHKVFTHNYRWINKDALYRTHEFFEKHGGKTIIIARFMPVLRTFAPFVAGVSNMSLKKYQFFNLTGAILWVTSLTAAGFFFGNIPLIRNHLHTIILIGILAAALPVALSGVWRICRHIMPNK